MEVWNEVVHHPSHHPILQVEESQMTGFHLGVFLIDLGNVFITFGVTLFAIVVVAWLWLLYEEKK